MPNVGGGAGLTLAALIAFASLLMVLPLVQLLSAGLMADGTLSLGPFRDALDSRSVPRALSHSLESAAISAALSLAAGTVIALLIGLTDLRGKAVLTFLVLTCLSFSLFGFIIGIWANNFEQLQLIPLIVITPLVFLGGSFYSISMLPPVWQTISLFNPIVYLVSGFRWSFFGLADVPIATSLMAIAVFTALCLATIWWIFKTGWRIRQ